MLPSTNVRLLLLVFLLNTSSGVRAEHHTLDTLDPFLLAVTITSIDIGDFAGFDAFWYTHKATVEEVIAGEFREAQITYMTRQVSPGRPVFPAQFVLIFEHDDDEFETMFGTRFEAIDWRKAEKTTCFYHDLEEAFPSESRFKRVTPDSEEDSDFCYESKVLLADH